MRLKWLTGLQNMAREVRDNNAIVYLFNDFGHLQI
jgi:hypothetical protein